MKLLHHFYSTIGVRPSAVYGNMVGHAHEFVR